MAPATGAAARCRATTSTSASSAVAFRRRRVGVASGRRRRERTRRGASETRDGDGGDDPWLQKMMDAAMEDERRAGEARDAQGVEDAAAPERDAATTNAASVAKKDDEWEYEPETSHGDLSEEREAEILGITARATAKTVADAAASTPSGPPAVILVGFRAEEWPRVRVLVDELGGYDVPVIPARSEHAWMTLEEVARTREPDWESPRDAALARGGQYGSQRAVIFSGLDLGEVAVIVSAIEARGLPRLPVVVADAENSRAPLGESLATALRRARRDARRKRPSRAVTTASTDPHPDALGDSPRDVIVGELVASPASSPSPSPSRAAAESRRRGSRDADVRTDAAAFIVPRPDE